MYKDDLVKIKHIKDAVSEIEIFTLNKTRKTLDEDKVLTYALVKLIEVIGEAASKISPEFRIKHNKIPWNKIIGMRNHLVHVYFDIDLDILWDTISIDIVELKACLNEI